MAAAIGLRTSARAFSGHVTARWLSAMLAVAVAVWVALGGWR